jgi:tetratricopeptide (TPR) repeat protein
VAARERRLRLDGLEAEALLARAAALREGAAVPGGARLRLAEAGQAAARAARLLLRSRGAADPAVARALAALGATREAQGRYGAARALFEQALDVQVPAPRLSFLPPHPTPPPFSRSSFSLSLLLSLSLSFSRALSSLPLSPLPLSARSEPCAQRNGASD